MRNTYARKLIHSFELATLDYDNMERSNWTASDRIDCIIHYMHSKAALLAYVDRCRVVKTLGNSK